MSAVTETKEALEMWPSCAETRRFRIPLLRLDRDRSFSEGQRFASIGVCDSASLAGGDRSHPLAEVDYRLLGPSGRRRERLWFQWGLDMSGTQRLPGGQPRKASQRHTRRAAALQSRVSRAWRPGDQVRWRDRTGVFHRDLGDGENAEIVITDRTYRVRLGDLT